MASKKEKEHVWQKAKKIRGKNPNTHRRDDKGNEIFKPAYGKNSEKGWEIDHKKPVSKGGSESLKNKRALQTSENRKKNKKYPY